MSFGEWWGCGEMIDGKLSGGLYLASNLNKSCRAWNINIDNPNHLGSCEDKKHLLTEDIEHV